MAQLFAGWVQSKYVGNPARTQDFAVRQYIPCGLITDSQGKTDPDNEVHGANMGPSLDRQDPYGPHVSSMNFTIRGGNEKRYDRQKSVDWSRSL